MIEAAAMRFKLRYVVEDTQGDVVRVYFRRKGFPKVRLRGLPGSPEFMASYQAALAGQPIATEGREAAAGSFRWLVTRYTGSETFKRLDAVTRGQRRFHFDEICKTSAGKPIALLTPKHVARLLEKLSATPEAANARRKALRAMFKWGFKNIDEVETNPTIGVDKIKGPKSNGFHSWAIEEVAQFERRHPIGTKARLALAIILYTAGRREDAVRLGPQHIHETENGRRLRFRQGKNEDRAPVDIDIPLHPTLARIIDATPSGHLSFLVTEHGKPHTPNGFGNKFKDWCRQAGLPHCTAHGVRKATSARLAEEGASPHEIMSITGHQTLDEVVRYTRDAQRPGMADKAMARLK